MTSVPLNFIDHSTLILERMLLHQGLPGLAAQVNIHFQGRVDLAQLQDAADRLARRWPLLTARLRRSPRPAWVPTGAGHLRIRRETLNSNSEDDLLRMLFRLIGDRIDIENDDPMRLTLLHAPDGNDVLVLQCSHVLIDGHGAAILLPQLLDPTRIPPVSDTAATSADSVNEKLLKAPWLKRMRMVIQLLRWRRHTPPISLPQLDQSARPSLGRMTRRWIDETTASVLQKRLAAIGAFANPSVLLTASGFRVLSRYVRGPLDPSSVYEMRIGYNHRFGSSKRQIFHNHVALIILTAEPTALDDRDELTRLLAAQMRKKLGEDNHLAAWQMMKFISQIDSWAPWLADRVVRFRDRSLRVSTVPDFLGTGRKALGATIDYCWGHTICPYGVSMDLFQVGRRHLIVFMHSPESLSDEQASDFLDDWLDDLYRP